jgi:hypothetical protein
MKSETLGDVTGLFKKDSFEGTSIERGMRDCNESNETEYFHR